MRVFCLPFSSILNHRAHVTFFFVVRLFVCSLYVVRLFVVRCSFVCREKCRRACVAARAALGAARRQKEAGDRYGYEYRYRNERTGGGGEAVPPSPPPPPPLSIQWEKAAGLPVEALFRVSGTNNTNNNSLGSSSSSNNNNNNNDNNSSSGGGGGGAGWFSATILSVRKRREGERTDDEGSKDDDQGKSDLVVRVAYDDGGVATLSTDAVRAPAAVVRSAATWTAEDVGNNNNNNNNNNSNNNNSNANARSKDDEIDGREGARVTTTAAAAAATSSSSTSMIGARRRLDVSPPSAEALDLEESAMDCDECEGIMLYNQLCDLPKILHRVDTSSYANSSKKIQQ